MSSCCKLTFRNRVGEYASILLSDSQGNARKSYISIAINTDRPEIKPRLAAHAFEQSILHKVSPVSRIALITMASPALIKALAPAFVAFSLLLSGKTLDDSLLAVQGTNMASVNMDAAPYAGQLVQALSNNTLSEDAAIPRNGNAYLYPCYGCNCDETAEAVDFSGSTSCNQVPNSGGTIRGVGTTRAGAFGKETTCSLFTDNNCQDEVRTSSNSAQSWSEALILMVSQIQSITGIGIGQTWQCKMVNADFQSWRCYWNA